MAPEAHLILYGEKGFHAIEVKSSSRLRKEDFDGLLEFKKDYKEAKLLFLYGGNRQYYENDILVMPLEDFFKTTHKIF